MTETSFKDLGLRSELLTALDKLGFENPTPIQAQSIPHLIHEHSDLIALAQTGTGKTAAFSLPLLHQIDSNNHSTQALILSPTRELCLQIAQDIEALSKDMPRISVVAVYGGTSIGTQIKQLNDRPQVVVGTPGRTLDLINRRKLDVSMIDYEKC